MGMAAPLYYTADMVRALPDDGKRYEVVYGELLVSPAPRSRHQLLVGRLHTALDLYLHRVAVGQVFLSPADISWDAATLVQPDVFVVAMEEARTDEWARMRTLLLVGEVLSPSTARNDRVSKRKRYQEAGVPEYWIVNDEERMIERWTPEMHFPELVRERLAWHPAGAGVPFELQLEELFQPL